MLWSVNAVLYYIMLARYIIIWFRIFCICQLKWEYKTFVDIIKYGDILKIEKNTIQVKLAVCRTHIIKNMRQSLMLWTSNFQGLLCNCRYFICSNLKSVWIVSIKWRLYWRSSGLTKGSNYNNSGKIFTMLKIWKFTVIF